MKTITTIFLILALATSCLATLSTSYAPDQYDTDNSTTAFTATWGFFESSDLVVT